MEMESSYFKEAIFRILELASFEQVRIIYHFALHLVRG